MPEINSLEFHELLLHHKRPNERFADYDRIDENDKFVVRLKVNGKSYTIDDNPPNTNRLRPIDELLKL